MAAISGRTPPVVVEYTWYANDRRWRSFDNIYAARAYYAIQLKAGRDPKVLSFEAYRKAVIAKYQARLAELRAEFEKVHGISIEELMANRMDKQAE